MDVAAGQAVVCEPGEWVRYSTPNGAEYVAVCLPAFSPGDRSSRPRQLATARITLQAWSNCRTSGSDTAAATESVAAP